MSARYTSPDLSVRVEDWCDHAAVTINGGLSWVSLSPDDARRMAAGLCVAAERVDDQQTEAERTA